VRFTRHRKGIRADLDDVEAAVLAQCARELLDLVEPADVSDDPLAALVGMPPGDVPPPDDPVLARLLPDAYRDDPKSAGDFRRFTDADLRATKRGHATVVLETVPEGGGRMDLDRDQADAWLGCLNDVRLALGTSVGVTEETDPDDFPEDDPRYQALHVYAWLGYLQESLLSCLEPRLGS
jgi:hypothetical protein